MTCEHVHVYRTVCARLMEKFVDGRAGFFSSHLKIDEIVNKQDAVPYDAPGFESGHHGHQCCFDWVVKKRAQRGPAILALAEIVPAADMNRLEGP